MLFEETVGVEQPVLNPLGPPRTVPHPASSLGRARCPNMSCAAAANGDGCVPRDRGCVVPCHPRGAPCPSPRDAVSLPLRDAVPLSPRDTISLVPGRCCAPTPEGSRALAVVVHGARGWWEQLAAAVAAPGQVVFSPELCLCLGREQSPGQVPAGRASLTSCRGFVQGFEPLLLCLSPASP